MDKGGLFILVLILAIMAFGGFKYLRSPKLDQFRSSLPDHEEGTNRAREARLSRQRTSPSRDPLPSRVIRGLGSVFTGAAYGVGWGLAGGTHAGKIGWKHGREAAYARWDEQPPPVPVPVPRSPRPAPAAQPTPAPEPVIPQFTPAAAPPPDAAFTPVRKLYAVPEPVSAVPLNEGVNDTVNNVNTEFSGPGDALAALYIIKSNLAAEVDIQATAGHRASRNVIDWEAIQSRCHTIGLPKHILDAAAAAFEAGRSRSTAIAMVLPAVEIEDGALDDLIEAMKKQLAVADTAAAAKGAATDGNFYNN